MSAKRARSTITVTVVSDAQGRYRFPAAKLPPGAYTLSIRAAGYDLSGSGRADIKPGETTTVDLNLAPSRDVAAQLSVQKLVAAT